MPCSPAAKPSTEANVALTLPSNGLEADVFRPLSFASSLLSLPAKPLLASEPSPSTMIEKLRSGFARIAFGAPAGSAHPTPSRAERATPGTSKTRIRATAASATARLGPGVRMGALSPELLTGSISSSLEVTSSFPTSRVNVGPDSRAGPPSEGVGRSAYARFPSFGGYRRLPLHWPRDATRARARRRANGRPPLPSREARRRNDAARKAPRRGRSRGVVGPCRAPAAGSGSRLGDERQDDDRRPGRVDPPRRACGWPTTARARTSSRVSPPRCWTRAAPSSDCSRSTRGPFRMSSAGSGRGPSASATSFATSSIATASSSESPSAGAAVARAPRERGARRQRRRPTGRRSGCAAPRKRHVRARRPEPGAGLAPACRRLEVLPPLRNALRVRGGVRGASRRLPLPERAGTAGPSLDVAARAVALEGLERAAFDLVTPEGTRRVALAATRSLQRLQRAGGGGAGPRRSGASLDEIEHGLGARAPAFGRFERIAIGERRLLLLLIKNPGRRKRDRPDAGRRRRAVGRRDRAQRRDRRRSRRLLDLGRRPRAAARAARAASSYRANERPSSRLRCKYAGIPVETVEVVPDLEHALDRGLALTPPGGELTVLPTYTAMLALRKIVADRGHVRALLGARGVKIRVGHLYPDYLNIYADRGNIAVLGRRASWRGLDLEVAAIGIGETLATGRARPALRRRRAGPGAGADRPGPGGEGAALREAVESGVAVLAVCGGYQLLGRFYRDRYGAELPGAGILPLHTVAGERRMIGDVLLECELEPGRRQTLAGFENHAGRTILDDGAEPLGRVLAGFGNDGSSGFEGCRRRPRDRHVPPRAAAPAEPMARRLAPRAGGGPSHRGGAPRFRAARRRSRSGGARRVCPPGPGPSADASRGPREGRGRPSGRRAASVRRSAGWADGGRPRRARRT